MIGRTIGRYQIVEQLAEGGMAFVYKAYDSHLETFVALKVIHSDWLTVEGSAKMLTRFETEAKRVARLSHPNIIPILDYGKDGDIPYLVMKYISGGTLNDQMNHRYHWRDAARMLLPVARALSYAHSQGLVHRDVKPANILLTETGEPMLTDFGLVKIIYSDKDIDEQGGAALLGTPEYMAPEQALGKPIDGRADIYSLGLIFYEMLTGHRPFSARTPLEVAHKQINEPVPNPRAFIPNLPEFVERLILRMLAKDPADRYPDTAALCNVLERIAGGEELSTPATVHIGPTADKTRGTGEEFETERTADAPVASAEGKAKHSTLQLITWVVGTLGIALLLFIIAARAFGGTPAAPEPTPRSTRTFPAFVQPTPPGGNATEQPQATSESTATEEPLNPQTTERASAFAGRTATAGVQQTAAAQDMFALVQQLQEAGAITTTAGSYYKIDDFHESWAEMGSYQYRSTRQSPSDFVITARTEWQTASQASVWDASGCGFVFRELDANNHYLIYLGLDGNVYLKGYIDGTFYEFGRGFAGVNGAISGFADVTLVVQGPRILYYVDGKEALSIQSDRLTQGELNLTLVSGNSRDFGTRCSMTGIGLWILDTP